MWINPEVDALLIGAGVAVVASLLTYRHSRQEKKELERIRYREWIDDLRDHQADTLRKAGHGRAVWIVDNLPSVSDTPPPRSVTRLEQLEHEIWPSKSLSWLNHDKDCPICYPRRRND